MYCQKFCFKTPMVKASRGTFVETEPSIKEVIVSIGEKENFVIDEIDDNRVFITREASLDIKDRISRIMSVDKNSE